VSHLIRCARFALLLAIALALAPSATAQLLDGQWIKLKVKAKGFTLDMSSVDAKATYSDTVYLFLTVDGPEYDYSITYENAPGEWTTMLFHNCFQPAGGVDSGIVVDHSMTVPGMDGVSITFSTTFRITFTLDGEGALKKAKVKSDSGHITVGTLDGTNDFFGSVTLKGKTVDPEDLPFEIM